MTQDKIDERRQLIALRDEYTTEFLRAGPDVAEYMNALVALDNAITAINRECDHALPDGTPMFDDETHNCGICGKIDPKLFRHAQKAAAFGVIYGNKGWPNR